MGNEDFNLDLQNEDTEEFVVDFGEVIQTGGGGGTSNFNDLTNRPKYNGQTMTGSTNIPKVPAKTSELNNDSDFQNGDEVESAISSAIANKQDKLTAGNNISISNANVISATDTTYSAGTGLDLSGTKFSVDTATIATQQDVTNEATARENADINLQGQIDAISSASDVTDIVGTYADLQAYDTQHLKDNDIIKVLQDENQNDETTYYRWSTTTETFTLIGEEGPYYTKSATDTLLAAKQDKLTAGNNIAIASDNTISATDTTYTAGTNVQISSGNVISATDTTYNNFVGTDGVSAGTAGLVPAPATTDAGKFLKADGTWDTAGGGGPTVVQTTGTSTTDVMSQKAVTDTIFVNNNIAQVRIGSTIPVGANSVTIGNSSSAQSNRSIAIGINSGATSSHGISIGMGLAKEAGAISIGGHSSSNLGALAKGAIALGYGASTSNVGEMNIGTNDVGYGYNSSNYRLLTGLYDPQSAHDAATKGYVDSIVVNYATLTAAGAPTTITAATSVGQLYYDSTNDDYYYCSAIDTTDPQNPSYTWSALSTGGGGGPTVVQTTGTSTTDVMSQNATTSMVFADPSTQYKIKIGAGASPSEGNNGVEIGRSSTANASAAVAIGYSSQSFGTSGVALGRSSYAYANNSTAIGAYASATGAYSAAVGYASTATAQGEVGIGLASAYSGFGYNNSDYRLLTGLYDGQSAHDAVTVGQVNATIDAINTALSINIPHIGAST